MSLRGSLYFGNIQAMVCLSVFFWRISQGFNAGVIEEREGVCACVLVEKKRVVYKSFEGGGWAGP